MFTVKEYIVAKDLQQAYDVLIKNRNNAVLGGLLWLKMSKRNINTAIDLSNLELDQIVETEEDIRIGSMCTLRQLETNSSIINNFDGVIKKSIENIVGIQFRNLATVGGSVFSRFGFSDLLTALLALDCKVELFKGGIIPLEDFVNKPYEKDILVSVIIKNNGCKASYKSHRNTTTDFPTLAVCVSSCSGEWKIAVGARPNKAALCCGAQEVLKGVISNKKLTANLEMQDRIKDEINPYKLAGTSESLAEQAGELAMSELNYGSNLRGTAKYRKVLAKVLVKRAIEELL